MRLRSTADNVADGHAGLAGPIIITRRGSERHSAVNLQPNDVSREFVLFFQARCFSLPCYSDHWFGVASASCRASCRLWALIGWKACFFIFLITARLHKLGSTMFGVFVCPGGFNEDSGFPPGGRCAGGSAALLPTTGMQALLINAAFVVPACPQVFNEDNSFYSAVNAPTATRTAVSGNGIDPAEALLKHTINGRMLCNLNGLTMKTGEKCVVPYSVRCVAVACTAAPETDFTRPLL